MVLAELEQGRAARGRDHLLALARKAQRTEGLFEWHTRDGEGRGSAHYAGSAGALGAAVIEGLLGVELRAGRVDLAPRLDQWAARARLCEPATSTCIDFDYRPGRDEISFSFAVEPARTTVVSLLVPEGGPEATVLLDGRPVVARRSVVGSDTYAVLETDGKAHRLVWRRRIGNERAPITPSTTGR
jgi:hypothetical protein